MINNKFQNTFICKFIYLSVITYFSTVLIPYKVFVKSEKTEFYTKKEFKSIDFYF